MSLEGADVFNATFRGEFAKAMQAEMPAGLANVMKVASIYTATGRIETQNWMSPVPDPVEVGAQGHGEEPQFGLLDVQATRVAMRKWLTGFRVSYDDMDDAQVDLYAGKPAEAVTRCQRGVANSLLETIRDARSVVSFEGTSTQWEAADSHVIGSGDNLIAQVTTDKTAETVAALYVGGAVNPLVWYDRAAPKLATNVNTPDSLKRGYAEWWVKYRGAPAFGFWWDLVFDVLDGVPTTAEAMAMLGAIEAAFQSFQLPDGSYVHQYTQFSGSNLVLVCSPAVGAVLKPLRDADKVTLSGVATDNIWKGWFDFLVYNGMNQA